MGTAVVAGTAGAVAKRSAAKQNAADQAAAAQAQAAAPPPSGSEDPYEQLKQLGELHAQGILTDEEFAAQKAKLLG